MRLDGTLSFVSEMNIMTIKSVDPKREADPETIGVINRIFFSTDEYMSNANIITIEELKIFCGGSTRFQRCLCVCACNGMVEYLVFLCVNKFYCVRGVRTGFHLVLLQRQL